MGDFSQVTPGQLYKGDPQNLVTLHFQVGDTLWKLHAGNEGHWMWHVVGEDLLEASWDVCG